MRNAMTDQLFLSEELSSGPARMRVDLRGAHLPEHALDDMGFLNYRLADVRIEPVVTVDRPDIVWDQGGEQSIRYDGRTMMLTGNWASGPLQKVAVSMLALRLEDKGLHPFHASAVRYREKTLMFLGGESNHGKSMCQIEACRRGGSLVATETTILDEDGRAIMGSQDVFIKKRVEGTERADKEAPMRGVEKFFGQMPSWDRYDVPSVVDVVVVPAIDGNFGSSLTRMIPFERQFQTLHSMQNYFLLNELLAPRWPMPIVDTDERRRTRALFAEAFCERPFYFVRAPTPQALMDEVDAVI
jgi:hypothetical protein